MSDIINKEFVNKLREYSSIAIIGLGKNVGKTTTLNSILELLDYQNVMLTSIGYDGEDSDLIFGNEKPSVFVEKNTIIATAKKCVLSSDMKLKILETTGFNTPLGEIIIVETMESGLIEIAGPSYNSQLKSVIDLLKSFNKNGLVFVDGALNRKTSGNPSVCDTTILCSGMTLSDSIDEVAKQTIFALNLLTLEKTNLNICLKDEIFNNATVLVYNDKRKIIDKNTTINIENEIAKELDKNAKGLFLNGPLTDKLAMKIINSRDLIDEFEIIVSNGTNVFIKSETYEQMLKTKIKISVLDKIDVCAIAMNPSSIYKTYDSKQLVEAVKKQTDKLVWDFVGGE